MTIATTNTSLTAVVHEADSNNSGIIKYMLHGDEQSILEQQIPDGHALAFTDLLNVQPIGFVVVRGVVKSMADILAELNG